MDMLERVTLGEYYFKTALLLRESKFINGILTNGEIWYGLSKSEVDELENLDTLLLRKILKTKCSVPAEYIYLELGCLNIGTILKARRVNYLHYLVTEGQENMLSKFFLTQWKYPAEDDWTLAVKEDLTDFGFQSDLKWVKSKSEWAFRNLVRQKTKEYAFYNFLEIREKENRSKGKEIFYTELKPQNYLLCNELSTIQAQTVFNYRTRMANYKENYRGNNGHMPCILCLAHLDSQAGSFSCQVIGENVQQEDKYSDIFTDNISTSLSCTLVNIDKFREEHMNTRNIEMDT